MSGMEILKEHGWYLSEHGYNVVSDSGNISDVQKMIKRALDLDLREIGSGQGDISQGNLVLQIQKLRNVAAPKTNEESRAAPRMLKLSMTDGKNSFQAVEVEHISCISLNTPPGTKILIRSGNLPTSHGIILLKPSHVGQVLGGKVANLIEKWELNKKLAHHSRVRSVEEGGPPPWIPFGKKIIKVSTQDKNFKALAEKEKSSKENSEFEAQRKDAIAEAAKQGSKKVFGGGNKQLLDYSVQKIVDQGFTIEQAEYALRVNRNNVDKALRSLQRTDSKNKEPREPREPRGRRFEKKSEESKPSSGKISLFDFLEDKLPVQPESAEKNNPPQNSNTQSTESTFDRSESKFSDGQSGKPGRPQKGNRSYQVPPRYSEEAKGNKRTNNPVQYSQYNGTNASVQNKPPRFQKTQENYSYYQDGGNRSSYQRSFQPEISSRNPFVQSRMEAAVNDSGIYNRTQEGKNLGNRAYNPESDTRSRHPYDASHNGRHNRAQHDGTHRVYPANPTDKNYKNQLNRCPPNDNIVGSDFGLPNGQRSEYSRQGNNRNVNFSAGSSWVWRVGDKCLAKYWEDNRYYNAEVTGVSDRTCVVQFKGFENYEEVLQVDCIPITEDYPDYAIDRRQDQRFSRQRYDPSQGHIAEMEFRRGGSGVPAGNKNYGKKRGQQRSAQPIYQPPAQRNHNSVPVNAQAAAPGSSLF